MTPHNVGMTLRTASAAVFAMSCIGAALVAATSTLDSTWATAAVAATVVALGAAALLVPVRTICEASFDEDGEAISMPSRRMLTMFLALAAALAAIAAVNHHDRIVVAVLMTLLLIPGVWCASIDQATHRIPTRLIWTALSLVAAGVIVAGWVEHELGHGVQSLVWGAACGAGLLAVTVITAGTPGLADVRLVVVLGTVCGYFGGEHVWGLIVFATMTAGLAAALQMGHRRLVRGPSGSGSIAFGPYLVLGASAALIVV